MARVPAPIFVVPMPGATVLDSDDVTIPADGVETVVDDHIANEIIEGSLRIAGVYGTRTLDLSADQPPSTVAATPSWMLGGPGGWSFTFTQTTGSTTAQQVLFSFDDLTDSVQISPSGGIRVRAASGVNALVPMTFSLAQAVTLTIRPTAGTVTVAGATTGNGTTSVGAWTWPAGVLGVGRQSITDSGTLEFAGTLGNVTEVA